MPRDTPHMDGLIAFLQGLQFDALPPAVIERVRWILVDTIGCMLGGAATELGGAATAVLAGLAGRSEATIVGTNHRADCVTAAFANAILSDALDFQDTLLGHPSSTTVPGALAIGELRGASGKDVLTAIAAGYEVGVRVGRAILPTPERAKTVATGYAWLGFCATAAAGRLLGLNDEEWRDAFGYVGACSPLPVWISKWERPLPWVKNDFGEQARAGVLATLMARQGVRTPRHILDSDLGFWRMAGSDQFRPTELDRGLGEHWVTLETTFKPYSCCRYIHSTLDALRQLRRQHAFDLDEIETVVVRSFGEMTRWFADYRPQTLVDAEFSVPYAAAMVLLDRAPGPSWYEADTLHDPAVLALADRVHLELDAECDRRFWEERRYAAQVEVRLADGRQFCARRDWPRGGREDPLSERELADKFLALAGTVLPPTQGAEALKSVLAVDRCEDIRKIMQTARIQLGPQEGAS